VRIFVATVLLVHAAQAWTEPKLDESDPLITSVIVYSQAYAIERWQTYCAKESPNSAEEIGAARATWLENHAQLYAKASQILQSKYTKERRVQIAVQARLGNDELESKLSAAPRADRLAWCHDSPTRILSPQMNLLKRSVLVKAIEGFRG
jgi:hypothetical protein